MASDRFELLDRLFQQAVALDSTERTGFLELACAGDAELRSEVEALLEADSEAADFIEQAVVGGSRLLRSRNDPLASLERVGKYEILDIIGEGGFGIVYKGRDTILQRHVAIKVCTSNNPELRQRFVREAEIAAGLQHPNITTLHDLGQEGEWSYLVQELLGGEDLAAKIGRREPMSLERRLDLLLQIARGLGYAHEHGVLHRDVKPANVRVLTNGRVKIMDFGIARWLGEETGLTRDGQSLGTVGYLSPEQLRNEEPDQRADLFAFGVLAYELLSYEKPFVGDSFSQVSYQVLYEKPRPLGEAWGECPAVVEQLVHRCLEKQPRKRFSGLAEVVSALEPLVEGLRSGSTELTERSWARTVGHRWGSLTPWPTRFAVGAALVAGVAVVASLGVFRSTLPEPPGAAARLPVGEERLSSSPPVVQGPKEDLNPVRSSGGTESPSSGDSNQESGQPAVAGASRLEPVETVPSQAISELEPSPQGERGTPGGSGPSRDPEFSRGTPLPPGLATLPPTPIEAPTLLEMESVQSSSVGPEGLAAETEASLTAAERSQDARRGDREFTPEPPLSSPKPGSGSPVVAAALESEDAAPVEVPVGNSLHEPPKQDLLSEGPGVVKPGLLERPNPVYPEKARRRRREAHVVVAVLVDGGGRVEHALIKRGDDSGLGFNESAITAAKSARFHPATQDGVAGRMWTEIRFDFLLQ